MRPVGSTPGVKRMDHVAAQGYVRTFARHSARLRNGLRVHAQMCPATVTKRHGRNVGNRGGNDEQRACVAAGCPAVRCFMFRYLRGRHSGAWGLPKETCGLASMTHGMNGPRNVPMPDFSPIGTRRRGTPPEE